MSLLTQMNRLRRKRKTDIDYLPLFLQSREAMGVTPKTLRFYKERLSKFICAVDYLRATRHDVQQYQCGA